MRELFLDSTWSSFFTILVRVFITYFIMFIIIRIMGYREIGRLSAFDLVVAFTIGTIAASPLSNPNYPFIFSLIALVILTIIHFAISFFSLWSTKFHKLLVGEPLILIKEGKILEKNMQKARINYADLLMELRLKNIPKIADVEFAMLEPIGKISAIKKSTKAPLTASDLGIRIEHQGIPMPVINKGTILRNNLEEMGLSENWLIMELSKQGGYRLDQIHLAQVDTTGNLYVDLYNDGIKQLNNIEKPYLLANLKKISADLELFSLQTDHKQAKAQYSQASKKVQNLVTDLESYLNNE